ncbi:hypothetical protein D9V41_05960 [Aeromicrobium phragmitis]|uniref:Uncharacterized protein n=1 Tax=Aeromicrobium phragmitis TaxID=2478914 RepID=A0A3L8PRN8_9ACTN|nr:hypothetical protein [Aeromicrobium phragmitis]RLV56612.1 hypothetical protein D9V41_05960 [Aeromicrobium phragmitis]
MVDLEVRDDGAIAVSSQDETLLYTPYRVTAPDGSVIAHESRGGSLAGAWATQLGTAFVEIAFLGDGPEGGELAMVVTEDGTTQVALGALVTDDVPADVPPSWPAAIDLALGLIADTTLDAGSKDDVERFHQRLLEIVHGL